MLITDLVQIKRLGEQKSDENMRLRRYLKTHRFNERRLRHIAEEIGDAVDCTQCANCCRVATVTLQDRDIAALARFLRLPPAKFLEQYTEVSPEEGRILRRDQNGCVFLDGTLCSVYEARPGTCENYPHLVRGQGSIATRMWQMVDRATYCPIVYNTLEAYKVELWR